jgi:hypothetical protein
MKLNIKIASLESVQLEKQSSPVATIRQTVDRIIHDNK